MAANRAPARHGCFSGSVSSPLGIKANCLRSHESRTGRSRRDADVEAVFLASLRHYPSGLHGHSDGARFGRRVHPRNTSFPDPASSPDSARGNRRCLCFMISNQPSAAHFGGRGLAPGGLKREVAGAPSHCRAPPRFHKTFSKARTISSMPRECRGRCFVRAK